MRKVKLIILFTGALFIFESCKAQSCPDKIKWKKLKNDIEVNDLTLNCVPLNSSRNELESFLKKHGLEYSDINDTIVYASIKVKSGSIWIEKKWLFEFMFDANGKLIELRVKEGLTGP